MCHNILEVSEDEKMQFVRTQFSNWMAKTKARRAQLTDELRGVQVRLIAIVLS